eukprot:ANDGO_07162.mRNA.1 hypothetical protein
MSKPTLNSAGPVANASSGASQSVPSKDFEKRVKELETERELNFYYVDNLKKRYEDELSELQNQLKESNAKRVAMNERLERVKMVESAIFAMYMENVVPVQTARRQLQEGENPMVMLDQLRAYIRSLQSFQDDFENELKSRIEKRRNETEEELQTTKSRLSHLENMISMITHQKQSAEAERDQALEEKEKVETEAKKMFDAMKDDQLKLVALLREQEKEMDELHQSVDRRDQILRHKEMKLMRITQLESEISRNRARHQFDLNQMRAQSMKAVKVYDREMSAANKIDAEKRALEEKLRRAEMQLNAFKNDANRTRAAELERKVEKTELMLKTKEQECRKASEELSQNKQRVQELERRVVAMKLEYDKIFLAAERERRAKRSVGFSSGSFGSMGGVTSAMDFSDDPALAAATASSGAMAGVVSVSGSQMQPDQESLHFYRQKLKERDREIADLSRKIKRMLSLEKDSKGDVLSSKSSSSPSHRPSVFNSPTIRQGREADADADALD